MAGRTHLQQALPTTFGLKCATGLCRSLAISSAFANCGGGWNRWSNSPAPREPWPALGDSGIAVMEALAAELGSGAPLAPWHVCRESLAETVAYLGLVCGSLSKIATDIILLAQTEVGEVAEPYVAGRGQSSTMPQKRNPIASEYILAATRTVQALVPVMLGSMAQDHERATGPWQGEALAIPQAFVPDPRRVCCTRGRSPRAWSSMPNGCGANLVITHGLIVAEAVMMGLAPYGSRRGAPRRQAGLRRRTGEKGCAG